MNKETVTHRPFGIIRTLSGVFGAACLVTAGISLFTGTDPIKALSAPEGHKLCETELRSIFEANPHLPKNGASSYSTKEKICSYKYSENPEISPYKWTPNLK